MTVEVVQIYNDPSGNNDDRRLNWHRPTFTVGVDVEFYDENDQLINLAI